MQEAPCGHDDDDDDDLPIGWSTCAGQLAYLVKDMQQCNSLLETVRGDDCPDLEQFLANVEDLTKHISDLAREISNNARKVLNNIKEAKRDVDPTVFDPSMLPPHDPGERGKIKTDDQRKFLIATGPHQPKLPTFPDNKNIPNNKQCRFSATWYQLYPHLEYSISNDAAY